MNLIEILKILGGFIGGGLSGAILNNIISKRNSKIQPIEKSIITTNVFTPNNLVNPDITKLTFTGSTSETYQYNNLTIAHIEITNVGNKDYINFDFGITLKNHTTSIKIEVKGQDRHHEIIYKTPIDFANPSELIDFTFTPFNRKDKYYITLFLTNEKNNDIGEIEFSSKLPIKFINPETISNSLSEFTKTLTNYLLTH